MHPITLLPPLSSPIRTNDHKAGKNVTSELEDTAKLVEYLALRPTVHALSIDDSCGMDQLSRLRTYPDRLCKAGSFRTFRRV